MEKLYKKLENGRYELAGYDVNLLSDGIWVVQSKPYSKSLSNMVWMVGNIDKPCNVITHATLQTLSHDVTNYVMKLMDEKTQEYKDVKKMYGNWVTGPLQISNISMIDLVSLILRQIAIKIDEDGQKNS